MLHVLAGTGLMFFIFMLIALVYTCVGVVEYGLDNDVKKGRVAIGVAQMIVLMSVVVALFAFVGWLIMLPLFSIFNC